MKNKRKVIRGSRGFKSHRQHMARKKKKKEEVEEEKEEDEEQDEDEDKDDEEEEAQEQKDIKLGEFELREDSVLLIKKTTYKGHERIDFRVWKNSPTYKGPTKQGFVLPMDKIDDFIEMVETMKEKLEED